MLYIGGKKNSEKDSLSANFVYTEARLNSSFI